MAIQGVSRPDPGVVFDFSVVYRDLLVTSHGRCKEPGREACPWSGWRRPVCKVDKIVRARDNPRFFLGFARCGISRSEVHIIASSKIPLIDFAAGEYPHAAKCDFRVLLEHQHFDVLPDIPQQHHRRSRYGGFYTLLFFRPGGDVSVVVVFVLIAHRYFLSVKKDAQGNIGGFAQFKRTMNVSDAVAARKTIRNFLDTPVSDDVLRDLLTKAARAPSGGNLQPWRVYVINGETMPRFLEHMSTAPPQKEGAYQVYPESLKSPYRDSRFKVGEDMYALLGIPREDKAARFAHLARNFEFFGAPAGFFCFIDRCMGPPQWSDLGMFLQTFMLLAQEAGLDTCPQEAWAARSEAVTTFVQAEDDLMLFCGMAIGHKNPDAPVNSLVSDREPLDVWAKWV